MRLRSPAFIALNQSHQSLRFFHPSARRMACHDEYPPSEEQLAQQAKFKRQQHEREVLVCKLGSMFARLLTTEQETLNKLLQDDEKSAVKALILHHREHRQEEHLSLIAKSKKKLIEIRQDITRLKQSKVEIVKSVNDEYPYYSQQERQQLITMRKKMVAAEIAMQQNRLNALQYKLEELQKMDVTSDHFLINRDYQDEVVTRFKF